MDIYEYAMQMEKESEKYYRELVEKTMNKGLRAILTILADADVEHYNIFQKMKKDESIQMTQTDVLSNVKKVFARMKEKDDTAGVDMSEIELYRKAQEIEKRTETFYREKAGIATDEAQKRILHKIADEENKHYLTLENIIEFVSRPSQWLENAEFYHLEEY
ncbi:MAG: Rubrerythrin [Syntrophorhabdus sp. PtaU1.Bin050]|nr:MAG: Rubrerythrin [Syntrophorhabdus sp. PtaU1.Bin050]